MIPRHAPPFGLCGLLPLALRGNSVGEAALEKYCAEAFQVPESILLPSARSGILLALQAVAPTVECVICPAYTCAVVHQAMQLSGLPARFIDSEKDGYMMNADDLRKAAAGPAVVVLCETYGLHYSVDKTTLGPNLRSQTHIWDMAMCIPEADDFRRLETNDVAVVSFGLGKCLYSGWGGLLLTPNTELAARIRTLRGQLVTNPTWAIRLRRGLEILASAVAHNRFLYGFGRRLADWRNRSAWKAEAARSSAVTSRVQVSSELSREWIEPMVPINRKLAMNNLRDAGVRRGLRRRQAAEYYRRLDPVGLVRGFGAESLPESHFPIRVAGRYRSSLRAFLARRGIDTATYFPFPRGLVPADYPNAARAAEEVILLPLGRCIREDEVGMVAENVIEGWKRIAN